MPEAAVLVGVVLSLSFSVYAVLFADALLPAVLVAATVLYAFVGFAVARDDDPAATLLPDPILAGGVLVAGVVFGYGVVVAQPLFGLFVALVVLLPTALYHARFGEPVNPLSPVATLAVAGAVGALVLAYGVLVAGDPVLATVVAVLLVVGAEDYRAQRGDPLTRTAERVAVAVCLGGAVLSLAYFLLVRGAPTTALLVSGSLVVVGGYFAL